MNSLLNCVANLFSCFSELLFNILQSQSISLPLNFNIFKTWGFFFLLFKIFCKITGSLSPLFDIPDEPPMLCSPNALLWNLVPCFFVCMVLECLGVWLHVFGPASTKLTQFFQLVLQVPLWSTHLGGIKEHAQQRTMTLKYYIYKFIDNEQNIYMNVT